MHQTMSKPQLDSPWGFQWDVIHFNVGMHDFKYINEGKLDTKDGKQVTPIESYKNNIHQIIAYLKKLSPKAKLIFATTTPVPKGSKGRIVGDANKYNRAALDVLKQYPNVALNDLYTFTKPNHANWWIKPGNVHYNKVGKKAQGIEVARIISTAL